MDSDDVELFTLSANSYLFAPGRDYPVLERQDFLSLAIGYRIVAIHLAAGIDVNNGFFGAVALAVGNGGVEIGMSQNAGIVAAFVMYNFSAIAKSDWLQIPKGGIRVPAGSPIGLYFGNDTAPYQSNFIAAASLYMVRE